MTPTALAVLRAEQHISVSAISAFLRCPDQYWHRYINRTDPTHRSSALVFGSAIHAALALFYRKLMTCNPPTVDELATAFADAWTAQLAEPLPVLFDRNDTTDSLRDRGVALVQHFHAEAPHPHSVLGVEEAFSVELRDPTTGEPLDERLVGAIDAITLDEQGYVHLLEHKTAARRRSFPHDLQGAGYSLVAEHIGLPPVPEVTYQLLLKTKTPALHLETVNFTDADRRDFLRTVTGTLEAIRAGAFYPRRDQAWLCCGCPYAATCIAG